MRRFPVELRKMWTGREVQEWLDQNVTPPKELTNAQILEIWQREQSLFTFARALLEASNGPT
jgi:hypothetical protein